MASGEHRHQEMFDDTVLPNDHFAQLRADAVKRLAKFRGAERRVWGAPRALFMWSHESPGLLFGLVADFFPPGRAKVFPRRSPAVEVEHFALEVPVKKLLGRLEANLVALSPEGVG